MSLIVGAFLIVLTFVLYRVALVAVRSRPASHWLSYWLVSDLIACLLAGLSVFAVILLAKGLADGHAGAWGMTGLGTILGGIAVALLAWLAVAMRRRAAAPGGTRPSDPLAP